MKGENKKFSFQINSAAVSQQFSTKSYFNIRSTPQNRSAIDNFFENIKNINKLIQQIGSFPQLGNLILLGYVSAVESYFREICRKVILIDPTARVNCESLSLSYGSAISYTENLLPEALLENVSFASKKNISDNIKHFLNIKGHKSSQIESVLEDFSRICQIRHCAIHRFNRLGSSNAIALGLDQHKVYIDKTIQLHENHLDEIVTICTNLVKVINNYLFEHLLERTYNEKTLEWNWVYKQDKKQFNAYYALFKSSDYPTKPNLAYKAFKAALKT